MAKPLVLMRNARTRLVLLSMVLSTAMTVAVLALVYVTANRTIAGETRSVVTAELAGLADEYQRLGVIGLLTAIERRSQDASERDALYLLTDRGGAVLAGNLVRWPPGVTAGSGWIELDLIRTESGESVPVSAASIRLPGGEGLLVGRDASARRQFDRVLLRSVGLALLAALALSLLTGWLLTRLVFSRLKDISRTAGEIVSGDLGRRIPLRGTGDEFDRMAATLNEMLDRIEELVGHLRTTSNSIAHDLRSPLSRLRQRVETLTDPDREPDERGADGARALAEVDHLLRVFSQLTEISRAEAGLGREEFEPVDLAALARNLGEFYEPLAAETGVTLTVEAGAATLPGHPALLAQALSNLLDNALRYAPAGSTVSLTVTETGSNIVLAVRDQGPGVPEEDLSRLAEPFVTLDPSRTGGNSGLGLALVAAIARMHGGSFEAENRAPGLEARLILPRGA
ncbi:HAMP domain-containing protein [Ruegeria pomeroyi]|uniref:histidine kinase n=1 Tax=Ruegeria alba TaxID=2916756 RepID=A0ABS9NR59_9RHOB|nr:ATP-binding protein [Ruegeria alba]MCE8511250.1 HAMP domain-containing protein [Ruegeria pomeroyi]MCE8519648.1 HAMP domain-containing protein [Ruegeria pomeroyi]MCE8528110.1 HAMP domain-containing protein [Ruegeria pomeroyi]MCG6556707.1 HAMP domain-containing histidine kinase [Ruegeria alba]